MGGLFGGADSITFDPKYYEMAVDELNGVMGLADTQISRAEQNQEYWQNQQVLWESMYGDLQKNISNYYTKLTADGLQSELNQSTIEHLNSAKELTLQNLKDRGMTNSGLTAQVISNSNNSQAVALAHNAYEANKNLMDRKLAYMKGIAMPEKYMNVQGLDRSFDRITQAYKSKFDAHKAIADIRVEEAKGSASVDSVNAMLQQQQANANSQFAGALLGGAMGAK